MGYSNINFDDLMEDDFENDDKEKKVEPVRFDKNNRVYLINSGELDTETYALISREIYMVSVDAKLRCNLIDIKEYYYKVNSYFMVLMNFMQFETLTDKHIENYDNEILNLRASGIYRVVEFYRVLAKEIERQIDDFENDLDNKILIKNLLKNVDLMFQSLDMLRQEKVGVPSTRMKSAGSIKKSRIKNIRKNAFGFKNG